MASDDGSERRDEEPKSTSAEESTAPEVKEGAAAESAAEEKPSEAAAPEREGDAEADGAEAKAPPEPRAPNRAAWGEPIARFERRWTWLETRLITLVLLAQILSLVAWVLLAGLATPVDASSSAGTVFRAVVGAAALSALAWAGSRKLALNARRGLVLAGMAIGILAAPLWRAKGVEYFDNVRGWLQEGSTLTLMGGLRGLATRLTLWLALLGASLATSAGKHIHVDLLFRALPVRLRTPAALLNYGAAALVCLAAVWGFFDPIAIESFGARAGDAAGDKVARVAHHVSDHAFLARKQLGLDLRTMPRVIAGERYDGWMTAGVWNEWVRGAGFEGHYEAEDVKGLLVPDDSPAHVPVVISPDGEPTRGILVHDLSLVFPFGLLVIGLRFLLRALLTLSGHISVDPDEAHKEELKRVAEEQAAEQQGGV
ncbi:MAG: TRAP transporter small permease subunit [Polyangiaceae bacterium]|nr:TRAP transporter small permease subunit [Polyangiaceae bacterium]